MKNQGIRLFVAVTVLTLLSACSSTAEKEPGPPETVDRSSASSAATDQGSAQSSGASNSLEAALKALNDPANPLSQRVIYFEYDSSTVRAEAQQLLQLHAAFLAENPGLNVRLEGHADERGSREYNLGLGERRSRSVERLMVLSGAGAGQLDSVSYGEERPVALGHGEESWWQNRRVEIVYPSR